jgi:hypothetical protein
MGAIVHERDVSRAGTEFEKNRLVPLASRLDRRGGRDDHDAGVGHAGERHEGGKDRALAELVLGSANCHDRAGVSIGSAVPHATFLPSLIST